MSPYTPITDLMNALRYVYSAAVACGCRNGLFLGRGIQGDLDVGAIGIAWAFFHVLPQSVIITQDVGTHGRIASGRATCNMQCAC